MPFCCERCGKPFRDRYNLNKHSERKNPCIVQRKDTFTATSTPPPPDTSGTVILINNGSINIQVINNESIAPDIASEIIKTMRQTLSLGGPEFDERRALQWITELHNQICKDPTNHNVVLKTVKSTTTRVLTDQGWTTRHTNTFVEELFKIRSSQLIDLNFDQHNPRVLTAPTIKRTMSRVNQFKTLGFEALGGGAASAGAVRARTEFKVAVVNAI